MRNAHNTCDAPPSFELRAALVAATLVSAACVERRTPRLDAGIADKTIVFVGWGWKWIYRADWGLLNMALASVGGRTLPAWLNEPELVKPSLVFMGVWTNLGFNVVVYLAALQTIPRHLLEAAELDGASAWQRFRHVVFPAVSPTTFFLAVTGTIATLQTTEGSLRSSVSVHSTPPDPGQLPIRADRSEPRARHAQHAGHRGTLHLGRPLDGIIRWVCFRQAPLRRSQASVRNAHRHHDGPGSSLAHPAVLRLDGATPWHAFTRIVFPLARPALITLAVFGFKGAWNDYFGPLVYLSSPNKMNIQQMIAATQNAYGGDPGILMAGSALAMVPLLVLFLFAQRYFIEGIATTGLK
jgi:ABC-type sugar transport system permease subunit